MRRATRRRRGKRGLGPASAIEIPPPDLPLLGVPGDQSPSGPGLSSSGQRQSARPARVNLAETHRVGDMQRAAMPAPPIHPFPWFDLAIIIALVLLNGVFAMSELAIVSARRPRLEAMARRGSKGARVAIELGADPGRFLS